MNLISRLPYTEDAQEAQKWELLQEFLAQNAYEMKLNNGIYQIYE